MARIFSTISGYFALALSALTGLGSNIASAQITESDLIFIVDESGSMVGEHTFLPGFVTNLDSELATRGIAQRNFGLTGFGSSGPGVLGRSIDVGTGLLGSAADFGNAAANLVLTGSAEDGFSAVDFVLNTYPAPNAGATRTLVLVTDEDRDNLNNTLTAQTIVNDLNAAGISLVVVVDGDIRGANNEIAVATDGTSAFVRDGVGLVAVPLGSTSGPGTTDADYIQPALMTSSGCVADLKQLREGGDSAAAFAEIFSTCLVEAAVGAPPPAQQQIVVAAPPPAELFLNVYRDSVYAVQMSLDNNLQQIISVDLGSDLVRNALAAASDDVQVVDDILNVKGLRAYLIVDAMTGQFDQFGNNKQSDYSGVGTIFGADYTISDVLGLGEKATVGARLSYHSVSSDVDFPRGALDTEAVSGQLYAAVKMPAGIYVVANAQANFSNYEQRRVQDGDVFPGETDGFSFSADIEAGFESPRIVPLSDTPEFGVRFTPFAGFGVDYRSVDGFQEGNSGVEVDSFSDTSLVARAGLRATATYDIDDDATLFFQSKIAAQLDLVDDDQHVMINNGFSPFEPIEAVDDVTLQLGAVLGANISDKANVFFSWNGGFSPNANTHTFSGGAVVNF